jgi:RNA recognition motif-containing protein
VTQPGGGRPRGFGFVEMQDEQDAHLAIEQLDGHSLAGRALKVNVANSRDD